MRLPKPFPYLLLVAVSIASLILSCNSEDAFSPQGDSDEESIIDGDLDAIDTEDALQLPVDDPSFSCTPVSCREGFLQAPGCILPDAELFPDMEDEESCSENADCSSEQSCVQAGSEKICVPSALPNWVGLYQWDGACGWENAGQRSTTCAVVGGWLQSGEITLLEQCRNSDRGRLCQGNDCLTTISFFGRTLLDISTCTPDNNRLLLMLDEYDWPPRYFVLRVSQGGLTEIASITNQTYYSSDTIRAHFTCLPNGELLLVTPSEILRYQDPDSFVSVEHIENLSSLGNQVYGAFDRIWVNPDDSDQIYVGIAGSYTVWFSRIDVEQGLQKIRPFSTQNWQTRVIPVNQNRWLLIDGQNLQSVVNEVATPLFTLAENERILGVIDDQYLLTATLTRLFRYPLEENPTPSALDRGLPFPASYRYYVPAIRGFQWQPSGDSPQGQVILQYRSTSDSSNGGIDAGWED